MTICRQCKAPKVAALERGQWVMRCETCNPRAAATAVAAPSCRACGIRLHGAGGWCGRCLPARHNARGPAANPRRPSGYRKHLPYLRVRDRGICQICQSPVMFDLPRGPIGYRDPRGPSVDHIIPRSQFAAGDRTADDVANLRLAHLGCNLRRGVGRPGEAIQLALVG